MTAPAEPPAKSRVRTIDWLRGLAVLVMIECHALVLLKPELQAGPWIPWLNMANGLVAPSFIFAAGFALAFVMVRSSGDDAARRKRAWKSLQRIGEVLAVAIALKWWFWRWEPLWLLRVDILSCIAYGLLLLWPVIVAGSRRAPLTAAICAALALATWFATPLLDSAGGWFGVLANPTQGSPFPLFPWVGYVFLGAAVGAIMPLGRRATWISLASVLVLGQLLVMLLPVWNAVFPAHRPWFASPTNVGERLRIVALVALALYGIEQLANRRGWPLRNPLFFTLETYGTNSLTAFVAHIWFLFIGIPWTLIRIPWNSPTFNHFWGGKAGWAGFWALTVLLWGMTLLTCWGWPRLSKAVSSRLPWNRPKDRPALSEPSAP